MDIHDCYRKFFQSEAFCELAHNMFAVYSYRHSVEDVIRLCDVDAPVDRMFSNKVDPSTNAPKIRSIPEFLFDADLDDVPVYPDDMHDVKYVEFSDVLQIPEVYEIPTYTAEVVQLNDKELGSDEITRVVVGENPDMVEFSSAVTSFLHNQSALIEIEQLLSQYQQSVAEMWKDLESYQIGYASDQMSKFYDKFPSYDSLLDDLTDQHGTSVDTSHPEVHTCVQHAHPDLANTPMWIADLGQKLRLYESPSPGIVLTTSVREPNHHVPPIHGFNVTRGSESNFQCFRGLRTLTLNYELAFGKDKASIALAAILDFHYLELRSQVLDGLSEHCAIQKFRDNAMHKFPDEVDIETLKFLRPLFGFSVVRQMAYKRWGCSRRFIRRILH